MTSLAYPNITRDIYAAHTAIADFNLNNIDEWSRADREAHESAFTVDLLGELSAVPTELGAQFRECYEMRMANVM